MWPMVDALAGLPVFPAATRSGEHLVRRTGPGDAAEGGRGRAGEARLVDTSTLLRLETQGY